MSARVLWHVGLAVADLVLLPYFVFLLAVVAAAWLGRRRRPAPAGGALAPPRFLFVIPAHDEESGIGETVRSCREVEYPSDRFEVAVIADNCADRTAEVARAAGARVVERSDESRKSKGYALEYFMGLLQAEGTLDDHDALVVVDADSTVDPSVLSRFAEHLAAGRDWVQGHYTVGNADRSWRTRLMCYAFGLFNGVLPLGLDRLGLGVSYQGNGMCLSTRGLRRFPWHAHGLVEDMEFSWELRVAGERVAFEPDAVVRAVMLVGGGQASASQRRRWEYGRKEVTRRFVRRCLASRHMGPVEKAVALLELTLPTAVALGLVYLLVGAANLAAFALGGSPLFLAWTVLATAALAGYALGPFVLFGVPWRYLLTLAWVPYFAVWKGWVALQGRPGSWVRTTREAPASQALEARRPVLGVLVNIYPVGSHTFIRRELAALEAAGLTVWRYAARSWDLPLLDPEDQAEEARTRRLLDRGVLPALAATALTAVTRPRRFARAVATAWRLGRSGAPDRGRVRHLIYLAEACLLRRWLERDGVTHLHAHFAHQPAATALFCRLLGGPPYSFTLHGFEEFERVVGATLAEKVGHAAFVVAVSSYARGQIWRWSRVDDWGKVHVVHCGLDRSSFPAVLTPPPDAPRVVCVGRFSEEKGHLVLVEAAAWLRAREPERAFEIVLVGDGPLRGVLEERVGRLGLAGHVRFAGWLSNDRVRAELAAARGLVLTSFAEGLPVVIMEALAMGRPVIAPQITGIPELVRPGENGWLVPSGDVEALASAIGALLDAPTDQLARMGQAGAERVGRDHDVRTEAGKLLDLIDRAGAGRG